MPPTQEGITKRTIIGITITVLAALVVCWSSWVSNSTLINRVAIAETRTELRSEMKGISNTLNIHYGLLKEIRDDQKRKEK